MNILFSIYWWFINRYYAIRTRKYMGKTYLDTWDQVRFTITGQHVERSNGCNICILHYITEGNTTSFEEVSVDYLELFSSANSFASRRYEDLGYVITEDKPKSHMPAWF